MRIFFFVITWVIASAAWAQPATITEGSGGTTLFFPSDNDSLNTLPQSSPVSRLSAPLGLVPLLATSETSETEKSSVDKTQTEGQQSTHNNSQTEVSASPSVTPPPPRPVTDSASESKAQTGQAKDQGKVTQPVPKEQYPASSANDKKTSQTSRPRDDEDGMFINNEDDYRRWREERHRRREEARRQREQRRHHDDD